MQWFVTLAAPRCLACAPGNPAGLRREPGREPRAGDARGEKGPHVVLPREAALAGNRREGGLSSDFGFKAFGLFWGYWVG